jgi:hypothetical protein
MSKRKRSGKRPQAKHNSKKTKSQHDKRSRLDHPNPDRKKTKHAKVPLVGSLASFVGAMSDMLDGRTAFRLSIIVAGMMLTDGRCVASAWFATAGVQDDWDRFYDCLISIGRQHRWLGFVVLLMVLKVTKPELSGRLVLAIDDSPTQRYGKHVEGAGVHHNPTPGPTGSKWLYGHNWVSLCVLVTHPMWGVIALPILSLMYVRAVNIAPLAEKYDWKFHTKHELALDLVLWLVAHVRAAKREYGIWVVADGAYAARPMLLPLLKAGVVVFSRLRRDAKLFDLPPEYETRPQSRPRIYGLNRISLAKRAGQKRGWQTINYRDRRQEVARQYKTFLATSKLISGVIRVVLIRFEDGGWAPYFCTDPNVGVKDILETISARWAIEEHFHDVKEIWGAGQQQVRNVWSNIGCWNLNQWLYTLVELCAWEMSKKELTDRSDRPWDNPDRRPSHADRRRTISREMLTKQFMTTLPDDPDRKKIQPFVEHLIRLVA